MGAASPQEGRVTSPTTTPTEAASTLDSAPSNTEPGNPELGNTELALGDCLDSDGRGVDCLQPHLSQVFSLSTACEPALFRDYLGASELDVVRSDANLQPWGDGQACTVSLESGAAITGSLVGSFAESRSDTARQLRHCLDTNLDAVACEVPHYGEVVGTAAEAQSCAGVAASYLGWDASGLPNGLELRARGNQQPECLITVKGDNALTDTLRDIGRRALPIAALD